MATTTNTPNTMNAEELANELARLRAECASLKANAGRSGMKISLKVSDKGAVSVYGLGRFPVTLYQEQWTKLLDEAQRIKDFIEANAGELKLKEANTKAA